MSIEDVEREEVDTRRRSTRLEGVADQPSAHITPTPESGAQWEHAQPEQAPADPLGLWGLRKTARLLTAALEVNQGSGVGFG